MTFDQEIDALTCELSSLESEMQKIHESRQHILKLIEGYRQNARLEDRERR